MTPLEQAISTLRTAGLVVTLAPPWARHYAIAEAAEALGVSAAWVRTHLDQFPNAWRLPAAAAPTATGARNVGELRIPSGDIEALAARMRLERAA